jgi:hypothetical protein
MHGSHRVMESCVKRTRVNKVCQAKLLDPPEPLKIGMVNEIVNNFERDGYETVNRVVEDLQLVGKFIHSRKDNKLFRSDFNEEIM